MAKEPKVSARKITDYRPDPANPNAHSERGVGVLSDSIASVGLGRSIVVDRNGIVLAGNSTQERAVDQGFEDAIEVETDGTRLVVVKRTDLDLQADDDNRARKLSYYDNRSAELGIQWDAEQLLTDINAGVDLSHLFTAGELDELLADVNTDEPPGDPGAAIDRAEQLVEQYGVKRGQLWTLGRHRVLCGSSYSESDRARLLGGAKPDMLHTDPPYGINIVKPRVGGSAADSGGAKPFGKTSAPGNRAIWDRAAGSTASATRTGKTAVAERNSGKVGGGRGDLLRHRAHDAERGHVQHGEPSKNQLIQSNLYPVIEGDDTPFDPTLFIDFAPIVIMWGANYYADKLPPKACWITWDKRENLTRNNFADCELAWTNMDSPARIFYHLWNGLHKGSQNGERRTHPTEKPVALFEEIGKQYADKGLWVDLFAGTGAQIVAAERSGATCYALEYEPLYVATILDRLERMGITPRLSE